MPGSWYCLKNYQETCRTEAPSNRRKMKKSNLFLDDPAYWAFTFRYAYNYCNHRLTVNQMDLTSMLLLGLFGTGHCLGMCGPLVLAFPAATGRVSSHLFYHLGRITTYVSVGAVVGSIWAVLTLIAEKSGVEPSVWIMRVRVLLFLATAVFLVLYGLSRLGVVHSPGWIAVASPSKLPGSGAVIKSAAERKSHVNMLLGFVLGFLPCGLSFAAFVRAVAAGSPLAGAALLAAFSAGTLPGLLLLGTGTSRAALRYRTCFDRVSGALMLAMAASLFFRVFRLVSEW